MKLRTIFTPSFTAECYEAAAKRLEEFDHPNLLRWTFRRPHVLWESDGVFATTIWSFPRKFSPFDRNTRLALLTGGEYDHAVMSKPLYSPPNRKLCPICGEVSYSAAGIHPQCSMRDADAKRMQDVKPPSTPAKKMTKDGDVKPWQKGCPKCQALVHVRKKLCECGYAFPGMGG